MPRTIICKFEIGKSLKGVIINWSEAEVNRLREDVGNDVANGVLKGLDQLGRIKGLQIG